MSLTPPGRSLLFLLFCLSPLVARAQNGDREAVPRATSTVAVENARVVQAPGQVIERATVVVRDGLVLSVGPDVTVPFDAERIAGDSLVVYAGFIDGLSHAGLPTEEPAGEDAEVDHPGRPSFERAGIRPTRSAAVLVDADAGRIDALRKIGFGAAHVVPRGGMLPGTGAVILLGDAEDAYSNVLRDGASLYARLDGASGVYPATTMAVIAKMRQLFRETARRDEARRVYAERPTGLARPAFDPVHEALRPVLAGTTPVFFHAPAALDVHRILTLRRDAGGFPIVLSGLAQGFDVVERLAEEDVPLLLTLDLPDSLVTDTTETDSLASAPDFTTAADTAKVITPTDPGSYFVRDFRALSYEDVERERRNLEARRGLEIERYYATAARLHEAGLTFGFTTLDVKPGDVHEHLRLMIEHGLPEEAALAALTTDAATVLGLGETLGTVEPGKIANLVVTDGPLFDEDTAIRYVFVDGRPYQIDDAGPTEPPALDPTGTWRYRIETPQGAMGGVITLTGTPDDLAGTITNDAMPGDPATLEKLVLSGAALSFSFDAGEFGTIAASATLDGDEMEGSLAVPGAGRIPLEGTRTSGPDR